MRDLPAAIGGLRRDALFKPEFIVQLSWDADDTDHTYLTSTPDANLPATSPAVDSIQSVVMDITGQTQKINPDIATSTIGSVSIRLLDRTDTSSPPSQLVTDKINAKLAAGDGLRGKIIRVWVGYREVPFTSYDLRLTYVVDAITYHDGIYTITASDIQRSVRQKIFGPDETNINSGIDQNTLIIPVVSSNTALFPLVTRASTDSNFPGQHITYIKIDKEVICINSQPTFDTTNGWHVTALQRGALGTRAVEHRINEGATNSRKPKIIEHVHIEGPAPKVIYALLTGLMYHGNNSVIDPFDFTQWSLIGTPIIAASASVTPTGWGTAYDITDDNGGAFEAVSSQVSADYTHGDTWTASLFIAAQVTSETSIVRILFGSGAASSYADIVIDPSTGTYSTGGTLTTIDAVSVSVVQDGAGDDWYYCVLSAFSTTTGTSTVQLDIYPDTASAAATGTITIFGASLSKGQHMGMSVLAQHWHLGIHPDFVRLADFKAIGPDYWNLDDDTGRPTRIENPGNQDGKKYIEKEILVWLGAFMPIYSTGELGLKRLVRVLSDGAYQVQLDRDHVVSYSSLTHSMQSIINIIYIEWNWIDFLDDFTKENLLIDEASIAIHGRADRKEYKFKTVHTGAHTDENMLVNFDTLRDRYSGPPLEMSLRLLPSMHLLEVGDTVKVVLDQVRDFNTGDTLNRTFEIQQITTNWSTGLLNVKLFGSSLAAGELQRTTLANVLEDAFYTSEGTALTSVLTIVAGAVTLGGTLTGAADMNDAASIFYYDGDLTINAGVKVTVANNVQLRIKGNLTINGNIDGSAQGPAGGAATTLFDNASGTETFAYDANFRLTDPIDDQAIDYGSDGWFGVTGSGGAFDVYSGYFPSQPQGQPPAYNSLVFVAPNLSETQAAGVTNLPRKGSITTMPYFDLRNPNGYSVLGIPGDLRGHGGPGGVAMTTTEYFVTTASGTRVIRGNGGAGGAGGAGLAIVCRGCSFGGSGFIDLSGGDAGNPTGYAIGGVKTFYGGHGAPGSPGALLMLIDGEHTNPDITSTRFIADMGAVGTAAGATEISLTDYYNGFNRVTQLAADVVSWPYTSSIFNIDSAAAIQDTAMWQSAHRLQYLPEAEEIIPEWGPPVLERGRFNQVYFVQKSAPPVASQAFGYSSAITPDGDRFAVSDADLTASPIVRQITFFRNVKNPIVEQTYTPPGADRIRDMRFDALGERLVAWASDYNSSQGRIHILSRSVTTWSLEQTLTAGGSTPATNEFFGANFTFDDTGTHLVVGRRGASGSADLRLEYWSRSGTTWTFQGNITAPSGVTTSYPSGIAMSGDGQWLYVGDSEWPGTVALRPGRIHLFEFTGGSPAWTLADTLTVPGYDADPASEIGYRLGYESASVQRGLHASYDGSAAVALGNWDPAAGPTYTGIVWMHAIERQGSILVHRQKTSLENIDGAGSFSMIGMSANGLLAIGVEFNSGGSFISFRRKNISEGFELVDQFKNLDGQSFTDRMRLDLSSTGQFIIASDSSSDINANNSGHAEIWEYYPEAD